MSIAAELLQRHIETLVDDHQQWQGLIADNIVWELAYAPAIGHPAKLSGREEVLHHVRWFLGAVENFRFIDPKVYAAPWLAEHSLYRSDEVMYPSACHEANYSLPGILRGGQRVANARTAKPKL